MFGSTNIKILTCYNLLCVLHQLTCLSKYKFAWLLVNSYPKINLALWDYIVLCKLWITHYMKTWRFSCITYNVQINFCPITDSVDINHFRLLRYASVGIFSCKYWIIKSAKERKLNISDFIVYRMPMYYVTGNIGFQVWMIGTI